MFLFTAILSVIIWFISIYCKTLVSFPFQVLSKEWELWWAVRSLDSNRRVGLVQAHLLEKTEDDVDADEEAENMVSLFGNTQYGNTKLQAMWRLSVHQL